MLQGEVGPPGQAGFEGGPGPQGHVGPRGMAQHGKVVSKSLIFLLVIEFPTLSINPIQMMLSLTFFLFKLIYFKGPTGARGEKGDPGRPGDRVS